MPFSCFHSIHIQFWCFGSLSSWITHALYSEQNLFWEDFSKQFRYIVIKFWAIKLLVNKCTIPKPFRSIPIGGLLQGVSLYVEQYDLLWGDHACFLVFQTQNDDSSINIIFKQSQSIFVFAQFSCFLICFSLCRLPCNLRIKQMLSDSIEAYIYATF